MFHRAVLFGWNRTMLYWVIILQECWYFGVFGQFDPTFLVVAVNTLKGTGALVSRALLSPIQEKDEIAIA